MYFAGDWTDLSLSTRDSPQPIRSAVGECYHQTLPYAISIPANISRSHQQSPLMPVITPKLSLSLPVVPHWMLIGLNDSDSATSA